MRISRAKNRRFIYTEKPRLSDRGYNTAVEVYEITGDSVELVASNYKISTASWKGVEGEAVDVLAKVYEDLKNNGYKITDSRVTLFAEV